MAYFKLNHPQGSRLGAIYCFSGSRDPSSRFAGNLIIHPILCNIVAGELRVYVCRDPRHERLVEDLKGILDNVRGKKPKLNVIRLKLTDPEEFPTYLEYLEEVFGGVVTAEYRRFGIKSLPAIV